MKHSTTQIQILQAFFWKNVQKFFIVFSEYTFPHDLSISALPCKSVFVSFCYFFRFFLAFLGFCLKNTRPPPVSIGIFFVIFLCPACCLHNFIEYTGYLYRVKTAPEDILCRILPGRKRCCFSLAVTGQYSALRGHRWQRRETANGLCHYRRQ